MKKGTIIGARQAQFDVGKIPDVEITELTQPKLWGKWMSLVNILLPEIKLRLCEYFSYRGKMVQNMALSVENTLIYLKDNNLLKDAPENFKKVKLWNKRINLGTKYEAIMVGLNSALLEHCYPAMCKRMKEGAVMSHMGLTVIHEAVEYTLEYLKKENLLKE